MDRAGAPPTGPFYSTTSAATRVRRHSRDYVRQGSFKGKTIHHHKKTKKAIGSKAMMIGSSGGAAGLASRMIGLALIIR
jgi:hypothetical protein